MLHPIQLGKEPFGEARPIMPTPSHRKGNRHRRWTEPQALATMFWALPQVAVKSPQPPKTRGKTTAKLSKTQLETDS